MNRTLSRRTFLRSTGMGAAALVVAACAVPGGQPAGQAAEGGVATGEKISLSFWTPGGSQIYCEGFGTIAGNYEAENANIDIFGFR